MQERFQIENGILKKYNGTEDHVTVPDGVTEIGEWAFFGCKSLVSADLPESLRIIGNLSFSECPELTSVNMRHGVTKIGEKAFEGCEKLVSISLPDSIRVIGAYAFNRCAALTSVRIPPGVPEIGWNTFSNCTGLTSVTIPRGVIVIGRWAFEHCTGLTSVEIPDSVAEISDMAFNGCTGLTSVTIPDSVKAIRNFAFGGCAGLRSIVIPDSVTSLAPGTFSDCAITIVCGEDSYAHHFCEEQHLTYIFDYQYETFHGLLPPGIERLASPFLADEEKPYIFISYSHKDRDLVLSIIKDLYESGWKVWYDEGLTIGDKYDETLEKHVKSCAAFLLFVTENSLDSLYVRDNEIPWAVEAGRPIIKCIAREGIDYEIDGGSVIATVSPEGIEPALEKAGGLVKGERRVASGISVVVNPADRGEADGEGFAYCLYEERDSAAAKAIILEAANSGCKLYNAVEEGEDEEKLSSCASLIVFLDKAFLADEHLRKILIDGFRAGRDIAVCQLEDLEDSDLPEELLGLHLMQWLNFARGLDFDMNTKLARHLQKMGCRNTAVLPGFEYEETDRGLVITKYTGMSPSPWIESEYGGMPVAEIAEDAFKKCVRLKTLQIPEGVTAIGKGAFRGCTGLTSVTIPGSVTEIGESAFKECEALTTVTIPDSITSIEQWTFEGCSGLTSAVIPDSVTEIRGRAFSGCKSLASIDIPGGLTRIDDYAFSSCKGLTSVTIPRGTEAIGMMAFNCCSGLTSVTIPDTVKKIELGAFCGCPDLASVEIPRSVTGIGPRAFENCTGLTSVTIPRGVTEIEWESFSGCTGLSSVTIPRGVKKIGKKAFFNCSSLTSVILPDSVEKIEGSAFEGCPDLTVICSPDSDAWNCCMDQGIPVRPDGEEAPPPAPAAEAVPADDAAVGDAADVTSGTDAAGDAAGTVQAKASRSGFFSRLFGKK